jgi:hypothetical protein
LALEEGLASIQPWEQVFFPVETGELQADSRMELIVVVVAVSGAPPVDDCVACILSSVAVSFSIASLIPSELPMDTEPGTIDTKV